MSFKKVGSPEKIIDFNLEFNEKKARDVICSHCKTDLKIKIDNGIIKQGSSLFIGRAILTCPKCKTKLTV